MKVTLELNDAQAQTILEALDLYSRVGCGQVRAVSQAVVLNWPDDRWKRREAAEACLSAAQAALFPELGSPHASYGIPNRQVPLVFRRAYDIKKHVEQAMAVARDPNPSFRGVNYDGAMLNVSDEPLPTVAVTKGEP